MAAHRARHAQFQSYWRCPTRGIVDQALVPVAKLEQAVGDARRTRDAIGQVWSSALAALRRGTRAAADDGAPDLHGTLFPSVARTASKPKKPVEPAPAATPNAA